MFKFELRIACPDGYSPPAELLAWARGRAVTSPCMMTLLSSTKQPDAGYGCGFPWVMRKVRGCRILRHQVADLIKVAANAVCALSSRHPRSGGCRRGHRWAAVGGL